MSQIIKKFIEDGSIDQDKIKLKNSGEVLARNLADDDDVSILQIDGEANLWVGKGITNGSIVLGDDSGSGPSFVVDVENEKIESNFGSGSNVFSVDETNLEVTDGSAVARLLPGGTIEVGNFASNDGLTITSQNMVTQGQAFLVDADETISLGDSSGDNYITLNKDAESFVVQVSNKSMLTVTDGQLDIDSSISLNTTTGISLGNLPITDVADPTDDQDAATKKYVDDNAGADPNALKKDGSVVMDNDAFLKTRDAANEMDVSLVGMDTSNEIFIASPSFPTFIQTGTVCKILTLPNDPHVSFNITDEEVDFGGFELKNLAAPTDDQDAATKKYVDDNAGGFQESDISKLIFVTQTFVLSASDITNGYIELGEQLAEPSSGSFIQVVVDGSGAVLRGASYDYTTEAGTSGTRINFESRLSSNLVAGDVVQVQYLSNLFPV
jgi:hypothetical protein